jgi:hypothetical protein
MKQFAPTSAGYFTEVGKDRLFFAGVIPEFGDPALKLRFQLPSGECVRHVTGDRRSITRAMVRRIQDHAIFRDEGDRRLFLTRLDEFQLRRHDDANSAAYSYLANSSLVQQSAYNNNGVHDSQYGTKVLILNLAR